MSRTMGLIEVGGFTPTLVAVDAMTKAANVTIVQAELNDLLGVIVKITGSVDAVRAAIEAGVQAARRMTDDVVASVLNKVDDRAELGVMSAVEFNPLIQQDVVHLPRFHATTTETTTRSDPMAGTPYALGLIETQGFTAVFEAIDTACKAANVEVVGKEKLGGGYVTIVIKGDVAAVKTAIESGKAKVEGLGKLIAAHVIPRPSQSVLALLPDA